MLGHTKFESNNILVSFKTFFLQGGEVFFFFAYRGSSKEQEEGADDVSTASLISFGELCNQRENAFSTLEAL